MKTLFIAGNEGAGKTPVCINLERLIGKKYRIYHNRVSNPIGHELDFIKIFEGSTKDKRDIRIVLNSAADSHEVIDKMIEKLHLAFEGKKHTNIVLITAARNTGDSNRDYLEEEISKVCSENEIIEFPLARLNENSGDDLRSWYHESIDKILEHILAEEPFNLF
ncbi:MAG: hypothetical protein IJ688_01540 [Treponema sp.]|nr:hypothetical protein [Treponema sp.]